LKTAPFISAARVTHGGFTLVESVIAIGIFAFVVVGIIGLFPAAVRQQGRSAQETVAVQAIQQVMASLNAATNLSSVNIVIGGENGQLESVSGVDLTNTNRPLVLGFRGGSSVPVWFFSEDGQTVWESGLRVGQDANGTKHLLLARVQQEADGLYRVDFEVGHPANVPRSVREAQKQVDSFSTKVYSP